jgi:hypothetical protein
LPDFVGAAFAAAALLRLAPAVTLQQRVAAAPHNVLVSRA